MPPTDERSQCKEFMEYANKQKGKAWHQYIKSWKGYFVPIDMTVPSARIIRDRANRTRVRKWKQTDLLIMLITIQITNLTIKNQRKLLQSYKKLNFNIQITGLQIAVQNGMTEEDFISRVEISMKLEDMKLWGPRPLEKCVHLREWERITAEEVYWYLVSGPGAYHKKNGEVSIADETVDVTADETVVGNETASTCELDDTLEATRDEALEPVPNHQLGAVSRGQESGQGAISKRPERQPVVSSRIGEARGIQTLGVCEKIEDRSKLSKGQRAKKRKEEFQKKEEEKMKKMEEKLKEVEHDRKVTEEKMLKERKERAEEEKRLKAYEAEVAKKEKRAQEAEERARRMAREKKGKDELTERTARELTKKLAEVDFAKNEALNAVEGNIFHPCTPEQVEVINKNKLMATGSIIVSQSPVRVANREERSVAS